MVAAELTARTANVAARRGYARSLIDAYVFLWAVTVAAAVSVVVLGAGGVVRDWLGLRLSPQATAAPSLAAVAALAAHNLPVCSWPLLLAAAGAGRGRASRRCADALVAVSLAVNAALVGVAFGAYGSRLPAYVPQLPFEWLALAAGAAGWSCTRLDRRGRALACVLTVAAVLSAAAIETYSVPHCSKANSGGVKRLPEATYR